MSAYLDDKPGDDPGTTTQAALLLCYGLGAIVWHVAPNLDRAVPCAQCTSGVVGDAFVLGRGRCAWRKLDGGDDRAFAV